MKLVRDDPGGCSRFHHRAIAGDERGARHAREDREREVPRRDHRRDPARLEAQRVRLAREIHRRSPARKPRRLLGVVAQEVGGFGDVGVGLAPVLALLEHLPGGELGPALEHEPDRAQRALDAPLDGSVAPAGEGARGVRDRTLDVRGAGELDDPERFVGARRIDRAVLGLRGLARPGDGEAVGAPELRAHRAQRLGEALARRFPAEIGVRRIEELRRRGPERLLALGFRGGEQRLEILAVGVGLAQDRARGGVLEQAPDEIGDARDEVAGRHVDAHGDPLGRERGVQRIGHPVEHLDFPLVAPRTELARNRDRVREAAQVVARDRGAHEVAVLEEHAREPLVGGVGPCLLGVDRNRPAALAGERDLGVPVGAFDQPHAEVQPRSARPRDQVREIALGVGEVGLQRDRRLETLGALGERAEHPQGERLQLVVLHVEGERGAARFRPDRADRNAG